MPWERIFEIVWRSLAFIVAVGIILIVSGNWTRWNGGARWQRTNDAYLHTDLTPIAAKVGGYLRELPIQDFQRVRKDDVLARIVDEDYRVVVAEAEAKLAAAVAQAEIYRAEHDMQQAHVESARAVIAATQAAMEQNQRERTRQTGLLATGSSASVEVRERLDTVRAQLAAQLAQEQSLVQAASRQLVVLTRQLEQNEATIKGARASLDAAKLNLSYTTIRAPQDGVIGQRQAKPGQLVGPGTQIVVLAPLPNLWVIANYKETQITHMAVGQPVEIFVDTFPGKRLRGHVQSFAPASGASFALLPPDNATGNFTKVVQRIPVKILIDDPDGLAERLVPGMSVEARVDTRSGRR